MTTKKRDKKKEQFLKLYLETNGHVANTCQSTGISRTTYYDWLKNDNEFSQAIDDNEEFVKDELEQLAIERAKKGSDALLIFLLKTRCKDRGYVEDSNVNINKGSFIIGEEEPEKPNVG